MEVFPKIPNTFTNYDEYKKMFCLLFQYEVYCKLLRNDNDMYAHMSNHQTFENSRMGQRVRPPQFWIGYTEARKVNEENKKEDMIETNLFIERPKKDFEKFKYFDDEDKMVNKEMDLKRVRTHDLLLLSQNQLVLRNNYTQLHKLIDIRELEFILKNPGTHLALVTRSINPKQKKKKNV